MTVVDDILKHHGVKGQKWGVRNDRGHEGEQVKTKQLGKLDKKWEGQNTGIHGFIKVHNAVADRMNNGEIDKFNNTPEWKKAADDGVLMDDNHPTTKSYWNAYETLSNKMFAEETVKLGMNPSGSKQYELREDADGNPYGYLAPVKKNVVKHIVGDVEHVLKLNRGPKGLLSSVTNAELELKHHGVKGQKWGVRKNDATSSRNSPTEVKVTQKKPGTLVKTSGGKRQPAHEDAIAAAVAKQKARASSIDSLSNKDLQAAVNRMNLEVQYKTLSQKTARKSLGRRFVEALLKSSGGKKNGNDPVVQKLADTVSQNLKKKQQAATTS